VLDKIKELKAIIDSQGLNIDIEVDGGISPKNVAEVVQAGANVLYHRPLYFLCFSTLVTYIFFLLCNILYYF
ncbi:hypothetical protein ACTPD5_21960, partial [Clostridioides difficile]